MSQITAKAPKANTEAAVDVNLGANLDESVALFGAEAVHAGFVGSSTIAVQNIIRRLLEGGKNQEEIQAALAGWKPGTKIAGGTADPVKALKTKLATMSVDEAKALLAELKASLKQ
jgi:hypothetical protein